MKCVREGEKVGQRTRAAPHPPGRADLLRVSLVVLGVLLAAGRGAAQVQGLPIRPCDPVEDAPVRSLKPLPPVAIQDSAPVVPAPDCAPPAPQPCGDPFRFVTREGGAVSAWPRTLLWEPPLASTHEPRFALLPNSLSNSSTHQTIDTAIGNTVSLLRVEPAGWPAAIQFDFFGLVDSRFADNHYFIASDYRYGFPITFAYGPWHGKFGYEHTSTHLGDQASILDPRTRFDYIKDEFVLGIGRRFLDGTARLYGQFGVAFSQSIPGNPPPLRFDLGGEWVRRRATGWSGQPFAAGNLEFNGATGFNPSLNLQAGWLWRDPTRRLAETRVFGEVYSGRSPYGQFYQNRETFFGVGVAFDY